MTNMYIGSARVSTNDHNLDLQRDDLKQAGCEQIFTDHIDGTKARSPGLEQALSHLRSGDILVVSRLDRLGRSLRHLIDTVTDLQTKGIGFKSLTEAIDTPTSGGKLIFHIFGALAELEREIIRERTQAGLTAARARGHVGGRRKKLSEKQAEMARELYKNRAITIDTICQTLGIGRTTFYRYIKKKDLVLLAEHGHPVGTIDLYGFDNQAVNQLVAIVRGEEVKSPGDGNKPRSQSVH